MPLNLSEISNLRKAQAVTEDLTDKYKLVRDQTGISCPALEQICTFNDDCEELYKQLELKFNKHTRTLQKSTKKR